MGGTDFHTLYIESGQATKEAISKAFDEAVQALPPSLRLPVTYKVNTITSEKTGTTVLIGKTFLWVSREEYFHMLRGFNPDGSSRVRHIYSEEINTTSTSWADLGERELLETVQDPPLMKLPDVETSEGIQPLVCEVAYGKTPEPHQSHHILFASGIPEDVPESFFVNLFKPYARTVRSGFPEIKFLSASSPGFKNVFVIFDNSSHDAGFALRMNHKVRLGTPKGMVVLIFQFANKSRLPRGGFRDTPSRQVKSAPATVRPPATGSYQGLHECEA